MNNNVEKGEGTFFFYHASFAVIINKKSSTNYVKLSKRRSTRKTINKINRGY